MLQETYFGTHFKIFENIGKNDHGKDTEEDYFSNESTPWN